jgi:hypothetical protein
MIKRNKVKCSICGREISKSNIAKHESSCKGVIIKNYEKHDGLNCQFCNKTFLSNNSLHNHEIRCSMNPNKKSLGLNKFNESRKMGEISSWNKGLTKEDNASVKKQSESLSTWYLEHPSHGLGGLRTTSARACKFGTYKGFYCDSGWELAFVLFQLDNNQPIERCTEYFVYEFEGKKHKYYPDFKIGNTYYEIKGIYRAADYAKIEQFPNDLKLEVVDKSTIYPYTRYCEKTYGKNYTYLYDRTKPSWLDLTDPTKQYNFNIVSQP